jgi:hypothetical protein
MMTKQLPAEMTVIEINPHRWGWRVFEAPGVEPVFLEKRQAIDYAQTRACFSLEVKDSANISGRYAADVALDPRMSRR